MTTTQRTGDREQPSRSSGGGPSGSSGGPSGGLSVGAVVRSLIWLVLVASTAGNTVASFVGAAPSVHLGLGALTFVCAVTLIVRAVRRRS